MWLFQSYSGENSEPWNLLWNQCRHGRPAVQLFYLCAPPPSSPRASSVDTLISILGPALHLRVGISENQPTGNCCLYLPDRRRLCVMIIKSDTKSSSLFSDLPSRWLKVSFRLNSRHLFPWAGALCMVWLVFPSPSLHTSTS